MNRGNVIKMLLSVDNDVLPAIIVIIAFVVGMAVSYL